MLFVCLFVVWCLLFVVDVSSALCAVCCLLFVGVCVGCCVLCNVLCVVFGLS